MSSNGVFDFVELVSMLRSSEAGTTVVPLSSGPDNI